MRWSSGKCRITGDFSITVGLHQGSALSPFLFAIVRDELIRSIQDELTRAGINAKLELWRQTLESRVFRLSRTKTEYMEYKFSKQEIRDYSIVTVDD